MAIDLSLVRILRLLKHLGNPHQSTYKAIHVAGTNGKGSTLAYLSAVLTAASIRTGKFTSPHLISYNDCVSINNETYPLRQFEKVQQMVEQENARWSLECTEFELLTATAFKIFELENVQLALIEVGLGGLLDATNVLRPVIDPATESGSYSHFKGGVVACGITKIGIDHESLLGSTLLEIAEQKAGIIKPNVPVVVDGTNAPEVLEVIRNVAQENNSLLIEANSSNTSNLPQLLKVSKLVGAYQAQNLAVALQLLRILQHQKLVCVTDEKIEQGISSAVWPGRLQSLVDPLTNLPILLDGAHNESAAIELGSYLKTLRNGKGLIFVVAMTKGKAADNIFKHIIEGDIDTVFPATFTTPENMPFVTCYSPNTLGEIAAKHTSDVRIESPGNVKQIFQNLLQLKHAGEERQIVVCGSLYLCSDVLRSFAMSTTSPLLPLHSNDNRT